MEAKREECTNDSMHQKKLNLIWKRNSINIEIPLNYANGLCRPLRSHSLVNGILNFLEFPLDRVIEKVESREILMS